jgi:hypothetical protein
MKSRSRLLLIVALVGSLAFSAVLTAEGGGQIIVNNIWKFYWTTAAQQSSIQSFINSGLGPKAYNAAQNALCKLPKLNGYINVYYYYSAGGKTGYVTTSGQNIYFNSYYMGSDNLAKGSALAYYTTQILFNNYTNASLWNSSLFYYRQFMLDGLAEYAARFPYGFIQYGTGYVRTQLNTYYAKTKEVLWMTDSARHLYNDKSGNLLQQSYWQKVALAYSFAGFGSDYKEYISGYLNFWRGRTSTAGQGLRSSNVNTAILTFETGWKVVRGFYANAGGFFTSNKWDTYYIAGQFYTGWYNR